MKVGDFKRGLSFVFQSEEQRSCTDDGKEPVSIEEQYVRVDQIILQ